MKKLIAVWLAVLLTATVVNAFNLSPYTFKLRSKTVAADSLFIRGDTLFADQMNVSVHNLMKAVAAQVDTVRGSSSIVGILDSAIRIDPDSSSEVVVITFGGYGGGLRWNQATDAMQYTNDFSTWTAIGTGGTSSTDADSLNHKVVRIRPLTDGYVLKYDSDGDSLYLSADATGAAGDSNAITYEADRIGMYTDTGLYLGDVGDSTMIRFLGDSTIIAFTKIYYGEEAVDSALITQGTLDAAIAALGNGDITGVITSDWITGGASSGDVALGISPTVLNAVNIGGDTVRIQNGTADGRIVLNVDGTPANTDELTVTENNIEIRSAGSNGTLYLSGYDLERVAHVAVGSMFTSGGTSSAPTWQSIKTVLDSLTGTAIPLADSTNGGAIRATTSKIADSTNGGAIRSETTKLLLSTQGGANTAGRLTADSIIVDTLFATRGNFTNLKVGTDVFITDITGDGLAMSGSALTASLGTAITSGEITDDEVSWSDLDSTTSRTYIFDIVKDSLWTNTPGYLKAVNFKDSLGTGRVTTTIVSDQSLTKSDIDTTASNWVFDDAYCGTSAVAESLLVTLNRTRLLIRDSLFANSNGFLKAVNFKDSLGTGRVTSTIIANQTIATADVDSSQTFVIANLRTRARLQGLIQSNNFAATDADSNLKIGSGAGLILGSYVGLGLDVTDDTVLVTLPAEWAGSVLSRGYGIDSTKGWDSLTISGGSDIYGNYIQFAKTATTSGTPTAMRRNMQIAIPVPDDADTIYDVSISYRVQDGTGAESSYVRLKWSMTPFDSSSANTYKLAYTDRDSSNSTTFDTLAVDYNRTYVTRGSKIYVLVTSLLYDFHTTWARCYDVMVTYHRNRL